MKTLSLLQPWASLIAIGEKRVETRSWRSPRDMYGERIAIHASKTFSPANRALCEEEPFASALARHGLTADTLPVGAVIATCTLAVCVETKGVIHRGLSDQERAFGNFGPNRYAWYLDDVKAMEPMPARGSLGLWEWELPSASRTAALIGGRTTVVHVNRDPYDVYIGREMRRRPDLIPLGWGNPWYPPRAIEQYREWIQTQPQLLARLPELRGKKLGCWCAPKGGIGGDLDGRICHGEVLAALADALVPQEVRS